MFPLALCSQWPAAQLALARAELVRIGVEVRMQPAPCAVSDVAAPEGILDYTTLAATTKLEQCTHLGCELSWEIPSTTAEERREAISHLVESVRARLKSWRGPEPVAVPSPPPTLLALAPASPPASRPLVLAPHPAFEVPKLTKRAQLAYAIALRAQQTKVLGFMPGLEATVYFNATKLVSVGASTAFLTSLSSQYVAGTYVYFTHIPWMVGARLRATRAFATSAWLGGSALYAGGQGQSGLAAQSGWGLAARAELRADLTVIHVRTWGCSVGARAGAWLSQVEVATLANGKNAASEAVRGADLGFAVSVGSAGW